MALTRERKTHSIHEQPRSPRAVTVAYYDANAEHFISSTIDAAMAPLLAWFLSYVPEGGSVLDWGSGSGRDSKSMTDAGYLVQAIDASRAMCAAAKSLAGIKVRCETFQDLDEQCSYDGIWANASLLHVPNVELPEVFSRAARALKSNGVFYASFKLGDFERIRNGRWFTFMDEDRLNSILEKVPALSLVEARVTEDTREERAGELWLNCLMKRGMDAP